MSLGVQTLDTPRGAVTNVNDPIVQPVGAAIPELDPDGRQAEAAPERWPLDRPSFEAALDFTILFLERLARGQHIALIRRPCAKLAAARAPREICVRFFGSHPLDPAFNPNLLVERRPVKTERRVRVARQLASLAAV